MTGMVAAEAAPLQVMSLRGVFYAAEAHSSRVGPGTRRARDQKTNSLTSGKTDYYR